MTTIVTSHRLPHSAVHRPSVRLNGSRVRNNGPCCAWTSAASPSTSRDSSCRWRLGCLVTQFQFSRWGLLDAIVMLLACTYCLQNCLQHFLGTRVLAFNRFSQFLNRLLLFMNHLFLLMHLGLQLAKLVQYQGRAQRNRLLQIPVLHLYPTRHNRLKKLLLFPFFSIALSRSLLGCGTWTSITTGFTVISAIVRSKARCQLQRRRRRPEKGVGHCQCGCCIVLDFLLLLYRTEMATSQAR